LEIYKYFIVSLTAIPEFGQVFKTTGFVLFKKLVITSFTI